MDEETTASTNEEQIDSPIEELVMVRRNDVIAAVKQFRQDRVFNNDDALAEDKQSGNWPSQHSVGLEADAIAKINSATSRMAVLNRLGIDSTTQNTYALVMYDDGVDRSLLTGYVEGKDFVATKRLDSSGLGDWKISALLGVGEDDRPLIPLRTSEEIRIPIKNTTYRQKNFEEFGGEEIHLTTEEQKSLQAEMTLKAVRPQESLSRGITNAMDRHQGIGITGAVLTPAEFEAVKSLVYDGRDVKVDGNSGKHVEGQSSATVPDQGQNPPGVKSK